MRFSVYCAAALAAGCASGAGRQPATPAGPVPAAGVPAAPAPAVQPAPGRGDGVRLGPSALRYVVHRRIHVEQQFQGQTRTVDLGLRLFLAATISGPADSVGYPLAFTIDSLVPDSGTTFPPTVSLATVRGLTYIGRVAPSGALRGLVPSDPMVAQTFAQIFGSLVSFYPRLPAGGLALGADWMDTVTTADRTVIEVTSNAVNRSRAATWEERSGARCLRLEVSSTYDVAGLGDQGGRPLEVRGSGVRSAVQFLAADGRYLGGEMRDSSASTVFFRDEGATIPVRQVSLSTIAVLP